MNAIHARLGATVIMQNPFDKREFLMRVTEQSQRDSLDMANEYHRSELVEYSHPNFVRVRDIRQTIPNDTLFNNQWHHQNTGQAAGTVDADVDSELSWGFTLGNTGVMIAVLDGGFDMTHPDLVGNYFTNPGELAGNGVDDDGNTLIDDVNGWDFSACVGGVGCGDNNPTGPDTNFGRHGTSVAGAAAAVGNNALGVTGSCPNCTILPIRISGGNVFADGLAFGYAQQMGAQIITNSWGYTVGTPATANVVNAINNAATAGSVILFAMNTTGGPYREDCLGATPDISSLANVIAVSASNNADQRTPAGYGNCMDIVAPTDGSNTTLGTLFTTTTDMQGAAGYNNAFGLATCPTVEPGPPPANARDYTLCFGGTSFSTPLTAGIAGLMLSVNPGLNRVQVQRMLQDTADKIEDSVASYGATTGFSNPTGPPAVGLPVGSTHGFGRVNAFEAVRVAAPVAQGGKGGVDIFIRDNRLDWGNTQQASNVLMEPVRGFIPHYRSVDIKVDAGPAYQSAPTTSAQFDAFTHENPVSGQLNRVYVRVHNRGPVAADSVTVKLHWAFAGTALPVLPTDFWTVFPADSSDPTSAWNSLGVQTVENLAYSGATIAGSAMDASQIIQFEFPGPVLDPSVAAFRHYCLFAVINSPQDPVSPASMANLVPDNITPWDNNVTHRNVSLQDPIRGGRFTGQFFVRNPYPEPIKSELSINGPRRWKIETDPLPFNKPFELQPFEEILVTLAVAPSGGQTGVVDIRQYVLKDQGRNILGGMVYEFRPNLDVAGMAEDCIKYRNDTLAVVDEGVSGWLLTDGYSRMAILDNKLDANAALALAKRHQYQCFIGRNNTRSDRGDYIVQYWK